MEMVCSRTLTLLKIRGGQLKSYSALKWHYSNGKMMEFNFEPKDGMEGRTGGPFHPLDMVLVLVH